MARTAQGSGPAGVSTGTTAQAATPGCSSTDGLEIFGMNVDACRGDDDLAFAAEEAQFAGGLRFGQIAGREPVVFALAELAAGPGCVEIMGPRTRTSPSAPILTSRPGSGLPMVPLATWKGWLRVMRAVVSVMP